MKDWVLPDASATENLGTCLAQCLAEHAQTGLVIYLQGELGAGKTTCVRALLRALGQGGIIRSPTYTLLEPYDCGALLCVHVDLYRLRHSSEVEELGLRDYLTARTVLLIEWPERGAERVPSADLCIAFAYQNSGRTVTLRADSAAALALLQTIATRLPQVSPHL